MALSRIDALLLYCLRVVPDTRDDGELEAPSSSDWENLLEASGQHGVAPLLYHRLRTCHSDIPIPANVMGRLRQAYLENAARNMGLYHQLGKLLKLFRQDNISVIALKGAHLATAVYRDIALRPMGDIDLLVKQNALLRVQEILVEQGYNASTEYTGCAQEHLPPYYKKGSLPVEIHFHIVGPPFSLRIDVEKLFARAHMSSIQGIEILTLCPEDLLLHLCMHVSLKHTFNNGIRPLFDISQTIEHYAETLDWEQLLDRSKEWGVSRCVSLPFFFAKKFAGAPIPGQIMKQLDVYHDGFHATEHAEELLFRKATSMEPKVAKLFGSSRESVRGILLNS